MPCPALLRGWKRYNPPGGCSYFDGWIDPQTNNSPWLDSIGNAEQVHCPASQRYVSAVTRDELLGQQKRLAEGAIYRQLSLPRLPLVVNVLGLNRPVAARESHLVCFKTFCSTVTRHVEFPCTDFGATFPSRKLSLSPKILPQCRSQNPHRPLPDGSIH